MINAKPSLAALLALAIGACSSLPSGPSAMVLPGTGRSFEQFRADDGLCREFARQQLSGTTPQGASADSVARSAAFGTVLGAVAGAAINGRHGAASGAGAGLLVGGVAGAGAGEASAYTLQRRYDIAYDQCMYGQGHRIPVSGRFTEELRAGPAYPPPPPGSRY